MSDIGIIAAFLGGLLALLSPCSALLLPAFFAYSFTSRTTLLARTLLFYAGLRATLVPLGVAGSLAGRLFYGHRDTLVTVGGWTVILLGVAQVLGLGFGVRRLSEAAGARRSGSARSVFVLGAVYGLAGFCAGPILGGILTVAAVGGSPARGGLLLACYALGMALPMFVLALELSHKGWPPFVVSPLPALFGAPEEAVGNHGQSERQGKLASRSTNPVLLLVRRHAADRGGVLLLDEPAAVDLKSNAHVHAGGGATQPDTEAGREEMAGHLYRTALEPILVSVMKTGRLNDQIFRPIAVHSAPPPRVLRSSPISSRPRAVVPPNATAASRTTFVSGSESTWARITAVAAASSPTKTATSTR
ncbi:cytochrome c biogenesis CcdA family protein [Streptomyces sp. NPDC025273]|uniref:cytochrome c biogenesis CcdA family protein n=1 Tax=Streptomyces sp. NPDC025273 TaxID=3155251 RepID=UPI0033E7F3D6